MLENTFFNKYGIDVKFEFDKDTKEDNPDISTIIANTFAKLVEKQI